MKRAKRTGLEAQVATAGTAAAGPTAATAACGAPPPVQRPQTSFRTWLRLMGYVRPQLGPIAAAALAATLAASATSAWARLLGPLLESVLKGGAVRLGPWQLSTEDLTVRLPACIVGLAVVKATATWAHIGLMNRVAQRVLSTLRNRLYGRLLTLRPRWLDDRHTGELLSRFTSDLAAVEFAVSQALSSWVKDSLQVLGLLGVCAAIDPRLSLLTFIVLPGMILPVSRFARSARRAATKTQASLGALTALAAEQLNNLPVVQAYRTEPRALRRFDEEQERYVSVMKRSLFVRGAFTPTTEFIGILGVGLALSFGAQSIAGEPQLAGKLVSFLMAALLLYQPVKAITGTLSQVAQGLGSADRLFEILDAAPDEDSGRPAAPLRKSLRFDDVRLAYVEGHEALAGVSFEIEAGQHVALVGPSGAGKTSVLSVVLGFVAPTGGRVLWDGTPQSLLSRRSLREHIAWVPQEPVLLSGTVRDNLRIGKPDATEDELWRALQRAHALDFVRAFSLGLEEQVGERGARLSGGQRARLAIARAFLREPSLLILDEPTSALDAGTEAEVQAGLSELMEGRTTLVVAHRLSTVRSAERIVVMDRGRVVETGTHADLHARGGLYARLVAASRQSSLLP